MKFVSIRHGNLIAAQRVVAVLNPLSAPVKRIIAEAKEDKRLIDASGGKKTKSVLITDSDHVVLSSMQSATIAKNLSEQDLVDNIEGNDDNE